MSPLYLKDGKLLIKEGKLATSADCCCGCVAPLGSIITFEDYVGPPSPIAGYPDGLPTKIFKNTFLHKGIILFGDEPEPICVGDYYACAKDGDNNIGNDFLGLWVFSDLSASNPGVGSNNFYGPISGQFIQPNALVRPDGWTGLPDNEMTPIGLDGFKIKAGFFQDPGVAQLEWFDKDGNLIGSKLNTVFGDPIGSDPQSGYETFIVTREDDQPCIYSFTLTLLSGEAGSGYGVERIEF